MNKKQAFKLCEKVNPPLYPIKPRPYAVLQIGKDYKVIHLPTKREIIDITGKLGKKIK